MEGKSQLQDRNVAAALIKAAASPADFGAQFDLGLAYLLNEMFEEAIEPLERASELRPRQSTEHRDLGPRARECLRERSLPGNPSPSQ